MLKGLLLLILLTLLGGCLQPNSTRMLSSDLDSTDDDSEVEESTEIYWYSSQTTSSSIVIGEESQNVAEIRGGAVNYFLYDDDNFYTTSGSSKIYCLVINFNYTGAKKQLRLRAVPLNYNTIYGTTKVFRIDVPESSINEQTCAGSVTQVISAESSITVSNAADIAYSPSDLCATCTGEVSAFGVELYESSSSVISDATDVAESALDLSSLAVRIDMSSSISTPTSSCTNSECESKGYDCCLDGQCVYDFTEKPNASSDDDYIQALANVANNPLNYILWPNIYYICGNTPQPTPTPTPGPDVQATADAYLLEQISDYTCLQGAAETVPDYSSCTPDTNYSSYLAVRNDVWDRCGCEADPDNSAPFDPETACPDFGLKPVYATDNTTIAEIICDIPDPDVGPTPFSDTSTTVSARMAPHRFFDSSGTSHSDLEDVGSSITQEGDEFSYLDTVNLTEPVNGSFNMNSILGSMKVDLSGSFPARMINVDFEHPYIITAITGSYYTPCSKCASDSWVSILNAFPPSSNGTGLAAIGYTTSRTVTGTNSSHGNYGDTVFGRACWLPPTMIPFSHSTYTTSSTQRQRRLETQAAFYVNGYQRDWFGFNRGAIIGSFDGVSWFVIGHGRRVVSTSNKLFLAINAPFADVAEVSNTTVTIVADNGYNGGTTYDYDPELDPNSNTQNQGASCQRFHYCEKDLDCVTQLGWEYTCASITKYKSHWPRFDLNAGEIANDQISSAKFTNANEIVKLFPFAEGTNRCVYRGAGSPCVIDYSDFDQDSNNETDSNLQKLFTCAPNFYCASLDEPEFNTEIVRTPDQLESILFGQEANVLGRPQNYVGASDSLTTEIKANIRDNANNMGIASSNIGLCRPGKLLSDPDHLDQHADSDSQGRTDYISQIASCDSSQTDRSRVQTCPLFNMDQDDEDNYGNYILPTSTTYLDDLVNQNSCGAASIYSTASTFTSIEADRISAITEIDTPMLAKDACLRKAGAACHTNYDCGPNELHANTALFFDQEYFGDTLAEKDYWSQYLVCGQGTPEPNVYSENYYNYDLTQNRCCREVGKDFTMYTQGYELVLSDPEYSDENSNLDVDLLPSNSNTSATGRYSRYEAVSPLNAVAPTIGTPVSQTPEVAAGTVPYSYQWKTINDTARKTCCGSGWVRKFADGTHDWTTRNRNTLVLSSFKCLNYSTDLAHIESSDLPAGIDADNYDRGQDRLCQSPIDEDQGTLIPSAEIQNSATERAGGGCIHAEMGSVDKFEIFYPTLYTPGALVWLDTFPYTDSETGILLPTLFPEVPYAPVPYDGSENYFKASSASNIVSFYLPAYLQSDTISAVNFLIWSDDNSSGVMDDSDDDDYSVPVIPPVSREADCANLDANQEYCIETEKGYSIFRAYYNLAGAQVIGGIRIQFEPYTTSGNPAASGGLNPGNVMFYQTKLARFELLGIPQIFYEPLYCNDNSENLVADLFDPDLETKTQFESSSNSFIYSLANGSSRTYLAQMYDQETTFSSASTDNSSQYITTQEDVALSQVFMPNDFTCCRELGTVVNTASQCCSNYATTSNSELTCKLARGTDLNVYFNRFVSGDGVGDDQPGGGFTDDDFIPETGEIKLTTTAYDKLVQLGGEYCENGTVRTGGAFGNFYPGTSFLHYLGAYDGDERLAKLSIVDSASDYDATDPSETKGYTDFQIGFRWNHHYYCD